MAAFSSAALVKLTLVRHATLLLDVDGRRLLVDPMLRAAGSTPPIEDTPNPRPNPLVELPWPAEEVVSGVDGAVITHLHSDHFDDAADVLLPRTCRSSRSHRAPTRFERAGSRPCGSRTTTCR